MEKLGLHSHHFGAHSLNKDKMYIDLWKVVFSPASLLVSCDREASSLSSSPCSSMQQ